MKKSVLLLSMLFSSSTLFAAAPVILPAMVTVKGGQFEMGSTANPVTPDYPSSVPVHTVTVKPFRLAKYETTVGQFRQFVAATGYQVEGDCWKLAANEWGMEMGKAGWNAPANAPGDYHPVMCVSWDDAHAYLQWLSKETGRKFRLPSEAEWEFAARAGSTTRYPFGDEPAALCKHANVFDRSGKATISAITGKTRKEIDCDDRAGLTTVVGMYEANANGLYDMLGNAGELVEDCQHLTYEGAPTDGSAWTAACHVFHGSNMAVHRGGNYNNGPAGASPTFRGHTGTANRSSVGEGFRIAEDISGEAATVSSVFATGLAKAQAAERAK
jgi:formylglycine-generating enzyme required for sulfatase activity